MISPASYHVVFPRDIASQWGALPPDDQNQLARKLERAARRASSHPRQWPAGEAGTHRGQHHARVGEMWLLYRLDQAQREVVVMAFGRS
jgi:mRNA-degrading endonuclease RelE of RelBE toxin-antitoxin system